MWTLKYHILTPKLYEILIKNSLKEDTAIDPIIYTNYIKILLQAVTNLK